MTECPRILVAIGLLACVAALSGGCSGSADTDTVPEEVIRHNILGTAHLGQTKWAEAEAEFRKALTLRPQDPLLLTNTAIAANQQEKGEEAMELLRQAVASDDAYVPAHFNMGILESRRGEFDAAAVHFQKVAELDADDLFTRYYLGTSLARIDREQEAIAALRSALDRDPTHVSTLYALGRLLLQQGEQEEGMELITKSQEIRARSGLDEAVGSEYGEQGRLSKAADYPGDALAAPDPIEVVFRPGGSTRTGARPGAWTVVPTGKGATLLFAVDATLLQLDEAEPRAQLNFDRASIVALAAGDLDDDGIVDLALLASVDAESGDRSLMPMWLQGSGDGWGTIERIVGEHAEAMLDGELAGSDLTLVDRDHDGDLDLFWCWTTQTGSGDCRIGTQAEEGNFEVRPSSEHGVEPDFRGAGDVRVTFSDVDNDRDIDLLVAGPGGVRTFSNQRDGNFKNISETAGWLTDGPIHELIVADLTKDGWMDLVVATDAGARLLVNRNGRFAAPADFGGAAEPSFGLVLFDFDNDGFLDLVSSSPSGPVVYHNRGGGDWDRDLRLLRGDGTSQGATPLAALDADGDGDLDLALADESSGVALLTNEGGNANRWIDLGSRGVGDNHFGIGAKVEVLAGALRQKFEVTGPVPVHAGLGSRETVQAARYLWPSGVLQDEIELAAGGRTLVVELDRKGTSCPLLYAWRDGAWHFVTDFLGGAAVGYQQAPGVFNTPDSDEYVRIDGGLTPDEQGLLRVRMNNQLEEVLWFDQAELVVVDHPAGSEVYPDERLMPAPPYPSFGLFASSDVHPVLAASAVESGRDLSDLLRERDRRYVENFAKLRPKGYADSHSIELDLGRFAPETRVVLLLDGWIDYADSSANVAAHQAGIRLVPPRLSVADGHGGWTDVGDGVMGFPAGLPKTMSVELTGRFPTDDHRLRIATNMRIYWDRARVMLGGEKTPLKVTRVAADSAELRYGGFPRPTSPDGGPPLVYEPDDVGHTHSWKSHVGAYTGFGEVRTLLDRIDDRFVTTRNGDEIELRFAVPGPPPPGWERTYLLYADGFGKDMDPNSAANGEIGPIPFHAMPSYPYPADRIPPVVQDAAGLVPRVVSAEADGIPGALPLGRHAGG